MKINAKLCAVVGVAGLLAACSNGPKAADQSIAGSYVLVSLNDQPLPNSIPPVLNVTESSEVTKIDINGKMCNIFNGQAIYQNGVLQAANGVAMTRMYCSETALNELDTLIGNMLASGAKVEKVDGKLILKSGNNTLVYQQKELPMTHKDNTK